MERSAPACSVVEEAMCDVNVMLMFKLVAARVTNCVVTSQPHTWALCVGGKEETVCACISYSTTSRFYLLRVRLSLQSRIEYLRAEVSKL